MMDRMLSRLLNLTVVSMISAIAAGALIAGYWGLLQMLEGQCLLGSMDLSLSVVCGLCAYALICRRPELVDC